MARTTLAEYRDLFDKRAFANLATIGPDGTARVTPVWCDFEGGALIINTARGRRQDIDIRRDRRISVVIVDPDNPYRYVEIRGRAVEYTGQDADVQLDAMAKRYLGTDGYPYRQPGEVRVMYTVAADQIRGYNFPHAEWLSHQRRERRWAGGNFSPT